MQIKINRLAKYSMGLVVLSLLLCGNLAFSNNDNHATLSNDREDPVQFLHAKIDKVLTSIKAKNAKDSKEIIKIVEELIIPNVDFNEMGRRIAGRSAWTKANDVEREDFINEIKQLLIHTYVATLKTYTEEKIEFQNYYGKVSANKVQIKSTIIRPNKGNLAVEYRMIATGNSWKLYDLIIEGVSVLSGFSSQFSDDIKMNGIKFVTAKIKQHNKENY